VFKLAKAGLLISVVCYPRLGSLPHLAYFSLAFFSNHKTKSSKQGRTVIIRLKMKYG
jgi:hypothetical protein